MKHILYRRDLAKRIKDFTPEEARTYYKLRYESHTPKQREAHNNRRSKWQGDDRFKQQAASHNANIRRKYPKAWESTDVDNHSLETYLRANAGGTCPYCGQDGSNHIDHIVPLNKGGTHMFDNIQIICKTCNVAKSDQLPSQFLDWAKKVVDRIELS